MDFLKTINIVTKSITDKVTDNVTVIPFLFFILTLGISFFFMEFKQAAAAAFTVFGIIGITEHSYRKAHAEFKKSLKSFKFIQGDDNETFMKLADKVFGLKGWTPVIKEFVFDELLFKSMTTNKPSPFQNIAGPLCPVCKKSLSVNLLFYFPGIIRFKYYCLCGFKKILAKDPKTFYFEIREHFNMPIIDC